MNLAYKIIPKIDWDFFIKSGKQQWNGYANDRTFIHLSTYNQLDDVHRRKFARTKLELNILCIDLLSIKKPNVIKWEYHNDELYPHVHSLNGKPFITQDNIVYVRNLKSRIIE